MKSSCGRRTPISTVSADGTWISGPAGAACRRNRPAGRHIFYRMSLLMILRYDRYATAEGRKKVIEHVSNSSEWKDDCSCGFDIKYFLESGYAELTREERLEREAGSCQVVRMNCHGGDETVWYFVKALDGFYVIYLSDMI